MSKPSAQSVRVNVGAAPRVAALLHAEQGVHCRFGHFRLLHDEKAAHIDDGADVLDADGAFFDARAAGEGSPRALLPESSGQ